MTTEPRPYRKPLPTLHPEIEPFFKGGLRQELMIKRCADCGIFQHYPRIICGNCLSKNTVWIRATGRGSVYSYSIIHQNLAPGWREEVPYVLALVDLEEGVRLMTNIVECEPTDVSIGMPVEVTWERVEEIAIPKFRPARKR